MCQRHLNTWVKPRFLIHPKAHPILPHPTDTLNHPSLQTWRKKFYTRTDCPFALSNSGACVYVCVLWLNLEKYIKLDC